MNTEQIQLGGLDEQTVLRSILEQVISDFSFPQGFYAELLTFLFKQKHSFFDEQKRPDSISNIVQQLSAEDADNLLTVLEGAKALIEVHQLQDLTAYHQFMHTNKKNRFTIQA